MATRVSDVVGLGVDKLLLSCERTEVGSRQWAVGSWQLAEGCVELRVTSVELVSLRVKRRYFRGAKGDDD